MWTLAGNTAPYLTQIRQMASAAVSITEICSSSLLGTYVRCGCVCVCVLKRALTEGTYVESVNSSKYLQQERTRIH